MVQQTKASSCEEFVSLLKERIRGLSASYDLLVKNEWQYASLTELVRGQLAHFGDLLDARIVVHGPELRIKSAAAQAIGMALHELATNAAKYGALSTDAGHVDIAWRLERTDAGGHGFTMEWSESGGPTVVAPTRRGFGWRVLYKLTKMSLEADVKSNMRPPGWFGDLNALLIGFVKAWLRGNQSRQNARSMHQARRTASGPRRRGAAASQMTGAAIQLHEWRDLAIGRATLHGTSDASTVLRGINARPVAFG